MTPCDGLIHLFDCGVNDTPPICHNGNDVELGSGQPKGPGGTFVFHLPAPLKPGQVIYATDGCFDPLLIGRAIVVPAPPAAPALSPRALVALVGALGGLGLWSLRRLRKLSA